MGVCTERNRRDECVRRLGRYLRRPGSVINFVLLLSFSGLTGAQEPSNTLQPTQDLVFSSAGPSGLRDVAGALYQFNVDGVLNSRARTLEEHRTPFQALIRNDQAWPPEFAIQPFESVLCALNRHVCCPNPRSNAGASSGDAERDCRQLLGRSFSPEGKAQLEALWKTCSGRSPDCDYRWTIRRPGRNEIPLPDACSPNQPRRPWLLCVPAAKVKDFVSIQRLALPPGTDVPRAVKTILGCPLRARQSRGALAECEARVTDPILNALNAGNYREVFRDRGKVAMPVRAYTITLMANSDDVRRVDASAKKALRLGPVGIALRSLFISDMNRLRRGFRSQAAATATVKNPLPELPNRETQSVAVIRAMQWNSMEPGWVKKATVPPILLVEQNSFVAGHPELSHIRVIRAGDLAEREATADPACPANFAAAYPTAGLAEAMKTPERRHGAYVTSIVGARANQRATVGVLPASLIPESLFLEDAMVSLLVVDDFRRLVDSQLAGQFLMLCDPHRGGMIITNISGASTTNENRNGLQSGLLGAAGNSEIDDYMLVVAAAGDVKTFPQLAGKPQQPDCTVYPACTTHSTKNMISVVSMQPNGLTPSDFTLFGPAFDVAAVGETEVVGPTDEKPSAESGTSFAAPYVTALAALVHARYKSSGGLKPLTPLVVKSRILSTVDFLPTLDGKILEEKVSYGRVNYQRALDVESDWVTSAANPCTADDPANPLAIKERGQADPLESIDIETGVDRYGRPLKTTSIRMAQVLRLTRICKEGQGPKPRFNMVVVLPDAPASQHSEKVERYRNVTLAQSQLPLATQAAKSVPTSKLKDFTACMRAEPLRSPHRCLRPL